MRGHLSHQLVCSTKALRLQQVGKLLCRRESGCLKAASSQYAVVFGTPISVFGLSFYIAVALLCLAGLFWRTEQEALERVFSGQRSIGRLLNLSCSSKSK